MTEPDLPPPPPPLAPPRRVTSATRRRTGATGLRRVGGLAKALVIVLAVSPSGTAINLVTTSAAADAAVEEYLADGDEDAFDEDWRRQWPDQLARPGAASIAIIVLTIIWLFRIAANHRALGRQLTWAPGWAIGGWFLPPLLFIIPLLMLRESWKASAPDVPPGSPEWKQKGESPLVWIWFVLFSVAPIVLTRSAARRSSGTLGRRDRGPRRVLRRPAGPDHRPGHRHASSRRSPGRLVVRDITRRHTQLTGEATRR